MGDSGGSGSGSGGDVWIYHERQESLLCGQHALNNLLQGPVFDAGALAEVAAALDALERNVLDPAAPRGPSANVDARGNFSIQVLQAALEGAYGLRLPHLSVVDKSRDVTSLPGFVCHKSDHWFAIREIGGRFWNLNSMLELPVPISHFQLARHMEDWTTKEGYTIFAVEGGLPSAGQRPPEGAPLGPSPGAYHRMEDLLRGRATPADPWAALAGSGMKLDQSADNHRSSEDNDLQRALRLSLQETTRLPPVPEEPPAGAPGSVRLQLRLPDGTRLVRRFLETDSVLLIYAVCQQMAGNQRPMELKCGFPPKDMVDLQSHSIGEAKLAGESIQSRYL